MSLAAGQKLGPYEIVAALGKGGMGEVYRAVDTQLGREVAIKTITPALASDVGRKRRFLQEARAASALNHPGIVTIYDVSRSGDVDYIVMEFVRGRTLDRVIGKHGMRIAEVIRCAIQIADAIARAHAARIIHRDLKPSNIIVAEDGQVKILDFGLATLSQPLEERDDVEDDTRAIALTESPTRTQEGVVVGTVAYMSPEQAEGKRVDERSDIFSFGAVLYEMATGRRAFSGDTAATTMAAVLTANPTPPGRIAQQIPRDLERIILRCLRKDPARRFQTASDLRADLEELKDTSESGEAATAVAPARLPRAWLWGGASVAAIVILSGAWALWPARKAPPQDLQPVPLTAYPGLESSPSFSPDGSQVAFEWDGPAQDNFDIYVQVVGSGTPLRLTSDPRPDYAPAWSPDGRNIAFIRADDGIFITPPLPGAERKLIGPPFAGGIAWSPDGKRLLFGRPPASGAAGGIFSVAASGGDAVRLTTAEGATTIGTGDRFPSVSPDGRSLAFIRCSAATSCRLFVARLDPSATAAGEPRQISDDRNAIGPTAWASNGRVIYVSGIPLGRLSQASIDGSGNPGPLSFSPPNSSNPAVSIAGSRLAFTVSRSDADVWSLENGTSTRSPISSTRAEYSMAISPDGDRIAFSSERSGTLQIWVARRDGSNAIQLTNTPYQAGSPRWSPDSAHIVYDQQRAAGDWTIYVVDASGGAPRQLLQKVGNDRAPSYSRDGKWIYFCSNREGRDQIYRAPSAGGDPVRMTDNGGYVALESVDRRSLYYTRSGRSSPLFVRSLDGGPERQVVDEVVARAFAVGLSGIYYMARDPALYTYSIRLLDVVTGQSTVLGRTGLAQQSLGLGLDVSKDGKTVLYSAGPKPESDLMLVEGFR